MNTSLSQEKQIESLRNQARSSGTSKTATMQINGRWCTVTAEPIGNWLFQRTNIKIESRTLDGRTCTVNTCTVNFTYDRGRGVAQGLRSFAEIINKSDQEFIAETAIPQISNECSREQVLSVISSKIAGYTQSMPISSMSHHAPRIWGFLWNVENFVRQNDLSVDEISKLKQELRSLSSTLIIQYPQRPNYLFSINECDCDPHCRAIALRAESLEILLDAKACGQVGLERNVPPAVKVLGSGSFNTVYLAHRKPGRGRREASEPIALKPCDQSKSERNPDGFAQTIGETKIMIGTVSGSYRRNQATSMVQRMFEHIGKTEKITVPHVIATVSAAEMNGVPSIAMEALEGRTVGYNVAHTGIRYDSKFVCRETWMQLQDILTGQIDRHRNNVMLTKDGPVAIDHDLSFPTNPPRNFADKVPGSLVFGFRRAQGQSIERAMDDVSRRNYCMPPVIDENMYNVIMAIDLRNLENMYRECGLTRPEISAAMARAHGLKVAAQHLKSQDRVIKPDQWSLPHTQYLCNEQNSYAARHYAGK